MPLFELSDGLDSFKLGIELNEKSGRASIDVVLSVESTIQRMYGDRV